MGPQICEELWFIPSVCVYCKAHRDFVNGGDLFFCRQGHGSLGGNAKHYLTFQHIREIDPITILRDIYDRILCDWMLHVKWSAFVHVGCKRHTKNSRFVLFMAENGLAFYLPFSHFGRVLLWFKCMPVLQWCACACKVQLWWQDQETDMDLWVW